jgi:predicted acetyltransferase
LRVAVREGIVPAVPIESRSISDAELPAWFEAASTVFFMWPWGDPEETARFRRPHMDLGRTLAAFDGPAIVATYRTFPTSLTLPGNGSVAASALTAVTVRSTHRRRGILSRLVELDIAGAADRGEPVGILIAAEWPIYGRYGYGPATWHATWQVRARAARFRGQPVGTVEVVAPKVARGILPDVYRAYQAGQPGEIGRTDFRWDVDLGILQSPGRPRWAGVIAVHRDDAGVADGYAMYHGEEKWEEGIPDNVLVLDELHATSEAAELELWRYLCSIDLVATVKAATRREHEPLVWHVDDARAARVKEIGEFLWVRLYDVPAALSARAYERSDDLVIEVVDRLADGKGPAAGRYRLDAGPDGATCRPSRAKADLELPVAALGAAYLGGTRLADAIRTFGAVERTPGALARADALFRTADEPWCSSWF